MNSNYRMSKHFFLFALLFTNISWTQHTIDLTDAVVQPKTYVAAKTKKAPKIDGKADKLWDVAPFSDPFIDIEGIKEVKYQTQVKMLWDDNYLYVFAELEDPHVWGDIKQRDAIIYYNNDFEVFINSNEHTEAYGEIEINALNTVWDLLLNRPYRVGGYANFHWNLDDLRTAVKVKGTLNDPSDIDQGWSVEMAIPLTPYIELKNDRKKAIKEGDQWRINFSRVQWDHDIVNGNYTRKKKDGKFLKEYNWVWSNQTAINMHMPENWGIVQFTEAQAPQNTEIIENPDFLLKQSLYALFRETKYGDFTAWKALKMGEERSVRAMYVEEQFINATFFKTGKGYEWSVKGQNGIYTIDHLGVITQTEIQPTSFTIATWAHGSNVMDAPVWEQKLRWYDSLGISQILVGGSPEFLQELVNMAQPYDIQVHAWMWTLNRPGDTIAQQHPEWYAVNRLGDNSLEYRAYVDYYQWLSPFHPEAREHVKNNIRKLFAVKGLASIHLDYVRYVDVILGADLQPKYNLVQDHEMPEYDYGYHPIAREQYKTLFGVDPIDLEHPELSTEWRQFRLNAITSLVNEIAEEVHAENEHLSAAVFPFPEMSRQMVRQAWDDWNLDFVFPMIYHNFYRESIPWIGFATEQGLRDVDYPLYSGLYMPGFTSAKDFKTAIELAKEKGAHGVCLFTVDGMKEAFQEVLLERANK